MKRITLRILFLLLLLPAFASAGSPHVVSACGIAVSSDAERIDFGHVKVEDVDALVGLLDQMTCLTAVDMYESRLSKDDMDMLFNRYSQITFGWTYKVGDHVVRTDITAFSTLHGSSPDPIHTERDFQWLKFCKGLKAIDIGHNAVKDISWLKNFPELKVLILAVNRIEDLTPLAYLKELEYLELFTNRFNDLTPLKELTSLRDLNIKYNYISDISPLFEMTWLERLWIGKRMDKVPVEQIETLHALLPNCEIDWESMPTAGTWREHPHYDTIYNMFRTQKYVPFDK
ncbi:MAG: leucine-rich repeat domain-containing protein [Clostridia bacterium]|nr:leucine-rich repeat domain-containing protein [Clostridia bacterium]